MEEKISFLIEPELSYKIIGICFDVQNVLGSHLQEKYYQRAVEVELSSKGIKYEKELKSELEYKGESIGRYYFDFLIDKKILLELKVIPEITKKEIGQVLRYLQKSGLKLGIIANFGKDKLEYKRVINKYVFDL